MSADAHIRRLAFEWLSEQAELHGDALPREVLAAGFTHNGERVPLLGPQGIFKPRVLELPISITTVSGGPYSDSLDPSGLLSYKYRGTDPGHVDNRGLRELMRRKIPLVYFYGLAPGKYLALWPSLVVADRPDALTFTVAVDDSAVAEKLLQSESGRIATPDDGADIRRGYVTTVARRRIHQQAFRERVIRAYRNQCACCRLKHEQLLDAAHIIPDSDPEGEPRVSNGIALCKLHHAAFDKYFISVTPEYIIEIRSDVLAETDGPMLKHGLQGMHGLRLQLPMNHASRPDQDLLAKRHARFVEQTLHRS
jgi:putative restriction endonuclease